MKVIEVRHNHYDTTKPNETPIGRVDCPKCGSTLEYSVMDIRPRRGFSMNNYYHCVICPVCNNEIKVKKVDK